MPCQGPFGSYGYGDSYKENYLQAERRLCEARWLLLKITSQHLDISDDLRGLLEKHRAEQLEHRRGDKKQVIDHIDGTLSRLSHDETEIRKRGGEPGAALLTQRQKLQTERARITKITDAELLSEYWGSETRLTSELVDHE